ncbi:MAG: lysostaphin resistance A-like protein [Patescibacteria group bacterium]
MSGRKRLASSIGLLIAWGGTALLLSPAARLPGDPSSIATLCLGQLALWLLFAGVAAIVFLWEKEPPASLWLRPLRWRSFALGGLLFLAHVLLLYPATEWLRNALGLPGYAAGMESVLALPVWFRIIAVLTAGIVEETLFRAYAVTRLARLTGSMWLAVVLSSSVFAALHLPAWGIGPSFSFFAGGLAMTGFFIWRRDLLAMIVAHAAIDAWGLIVSPLFARWWA